MRLLILRFLTEEVGGAQNAQILALAVTQAFSPLSTQEAQTLLMQMQTQGLVSIEPLQAAMLARITPFGREVVNGQAAAPGVQDPSAVL